MKHVIAFNRKDKPEYAVNFTNSCRSLGCRPIDVSNRAFKEIESTFHHVKTLRKGQFVYHSGDDFTSIYIVRSGWVKTFQSHSDGDERITGFIFPGEIFGVDGFPNNRHGQSAVALDTSSICRVDINELFSDGRKSILLQKNMFHVFSDIIVSEKLHMMWLCKCSALERVALFILDVSAKYVRMGASALDFKLPMPRGDIASFLGLRGETASRIFSKLQKDGLICLTGSQLRIIDPVGLEEVASCSRE